MARPKGTTRAKKPIFRQEYRKLMAAVDTSFSIRQSTKRKFKAAFTLLYITGCRISEIMPLKVEDIEQMIHENEYSLTNNTKTKRPRLIIFGTNRQQVSFIQKSNAVMSNASFNLQMNSFIHKVLGELYSTHSFRAGYVTISHQQGLSLEHIRQDIGHKDIATTARYATVTNDEISQAKNSRRW